MEQAVKNMGKKGIQKQKNNEMERISIWFSVITLKVNMSQFIIKKQNLANILTKSKTCALYNRNIYFKQIQRLNINEMAYNIPCNRNTEESKSSYISLRQCGFQAKTDQKRQSRTLYNS